MHRLDWLPSPYILFTLLSTPIHYKDAMFAPNGNTSNLVTANADNQKSSVLQDSLQEVLDQQAGILANGVKG